MLLLPLQNDGSTFSYEELIAKDWAFFGNLTFYISEGIACKKPSEKAFKVERKYQAKRKQSQRIADSTHENRLNEQPTESQ